MSFFDDLACIHPHKAPASRPGVRVTGAIGKDTRVWTAGVASQNFFRVQQLATISGHGDSLYAYAKVHDVPVLHHVVLAFDLH